MGTCSHLYLRVHLLCKARAQTGKHVDVLTSPTGSLYPGTEVQEPRPLRREKMPPHPFSSWGLGFPKWLARAG